MGRWKRGSPQSSPQLALKLARPYPPRRYNPPLTAPTDTSLAAAQSVGAHPEQFGRGLAQIGDLAGAMMGMVRRNRSRRVMRGVALAATARNEVLAWLRAHPDGATADEIAIELRRSPFTVRPRCTELGRMGLIHDSAARRKNASGRNAIVWVEG